MMDGGTVVQCSSSVPSSPVLVRRKSRTRHFSWSQKAPLPVVPLPHLLLPPPAIFSPSGDQIQHQPQPLVTPCLDNLDLPFADDESAPITPTAADGAAAASVASGTGAHRRPSQRGPTLGRSGTRRLSAFPRQKRASCCYLPASRNRTSPHNPSDHSGRYRGERRGEPTHFRWNASVRIKRSKVGGGGSQWGKHRINDESVSRGFSLRNIEDNLYSGRFNILSAILI